jgi:predicted secreted protein
MLRSCRYVLLSHCLLAQGVRATGLAKHFAAAVKPVIQFCLDNDLNMVQMPCPETLCPAGGLAREPHGKKWYEKAGLRETSRPIAAAQVAYIKQLVSNGDEVAAIIGMDFSPACAVNYLNRGRMIIRDEGIYVEELKRELAREGLTIPFIGVNQRALRKLDKELRSVLLANGEAGGGTRTTKRGGRSSRPDGKAT